MRHFTGNPFVDAGMAGMCAAADVEGPEQLDLAAIHKAVETLFAVLLSESAFIEKPPYKAFATSRMAMIFPNSPLPQASFSTPEQKREKYRERIQSLLDKIDKPGDATDALCFVCGQPANVKVGIDWFPLVGSVGLLNFHPMLEPGDAVCAFCALCVQFLPFSLMQTKAEGGRLWFVHSSEAALAVRIAKDYGLSHLQTLVAAGEPLRFWGNWAGTGERAAVVSLLYELGRGHARLLEQSTYPVTAFLFSNDNREQFLDYIHVSHRLMVFFNSLQVYPEARERFEQELLRSKFANALALNMLEERPLMAQCLTNEGRLLGGWTFHRLYAQEVLQVNEIYLRTVEEVAQRLVASEDSKKRVVALRLADRRSVFGTLLDLVRDGLMTRQELYWLVPPGGGDEASKARDYLLAASFALQNGEVLDETEPAQPPSCEHPLVERIERLGETVASDMDVAKSLMVDLQTAQQPRQIRRAFMRLIARNRLGWRDFIFFCPPDSDQMHYQSRDYWLAFLYDQSPKQTDALQAEDEIATNENA